MKKGIHTDRETGKGLLTPLLQALCHAELTERAKEPVFQAEAFHNHLAAFQSTLFPFLSPLPLPPSWLSVFQGFPFLLSHPGWPCLLHWATWSHTLKKAPLILKCLRYQPQSVTNVVSSLFLTPVPLCVPSLPISHQLDCETLWGSSALPGCMVSPQK